MEARAQERRSVVASAKTVQDAIQSGLTMLGVRLDQVDVEVLSEGSRGLLGIGAENARVRLVVKPPPSPRPPSPPPPAAPKPEERAARTEPNSGPVGRSPTVVEPVVPKPAQPAPEGRKPALPPKHEGAEPVGRELLGELLRLMGIRATIESKLSPELADEGQPPQLVFNLTGDDLGILIGRRGETLQALQYLLRLMVSHRLKHWTHLVVDVENYRQRRRNALDSLAKRVAEEAIRTGRTQAMEPMPADERRLVHIALRNHPKVSTQSVGEGEKRKVTIIPRR